MSMRRPSIAHGSVTRRASRPGLAAPEGGFALFEEGPNAFTAFGLLEKAAEGFDFLKIAIRVALGSQSRQADAMRYGNGTALQDAVEQGGRVFEQGFRRSADAVHQAPMQGSGGINGIPAHQHFEGAGPADPLNQPLCTAVSGNQAQIDFGLTQAGGGDRYAEVAGHGQFQTATEGKTVDSCQNRLGGGGDGVHDAVPGGGQIAGFVGSVMGKFGHIGTGSKGLVARTGQDDRMYGGIGHGHGHRLFNFQESPSVEGVEFVGAVDGDVRQGTVVFVTEILHGYQDKKGAGKKRW